MNDLKEIITYLVMALILGFFFFLMVGCFISVIKNQKKLNLEELNNNLKKNIKLKKVIKKNKIKKK